MNRLAMAEEIARLVPTLAQRDKDEWKKAEQTRAEFAADYPLKRIPNLSLDEYVIGKGADNRSFCYRLEREMDNLGRILGATSFKFGVYFGHTKSDRSDRYRLAKHWGANLDEAFASVKQAIMDLLQAATKGDLAAIAENRLSPLFKGKLLFLYHPNQFAPIYAGRHLKHFIAELDLAGSFAYCAEMQRVLMNYRASWPELVSQHPALYMRFLYDLFGPPPTDDASITTSPAAPLLGEALAGAQFITTMPPLPVHAASSPGPRGKHNYEANDRRRKRIGDRGEAVVLALEMKRLSEAGKSHLAERVDHIAEKDDTAGYDILSFDEDGAERPIEVKATTASDLQLGFYITANELDRASQVPNYHLYFVFDAMSKSPRVLPMKKPELKGAGFTIRALNFHVTANQAPLP